LYTITLTDNRSCQAIDTFRLFEPAELTVILDSTNVLCNGALTGAITSSVSGGIPGYMYNWSHGSAEANPIGLLAGAYVVTITDDNGCEAIASTSINEPTAIVVESTKTDIDCFGNINGSVDVTTTGGTMPYSFDWNTNQNTEDISALGAGNYTITVTDNNGCEQSASVLIEAPMEINQTFNVSDVRCFGDATGIIGTSTIGGTGSFTYSWSNGANSSSLMNLASGWYIVTVADQNGCTDIDSVQIGEPAQPLSVDVMTQDLVCFGDGNGTIDLDVIGGTGPYRFLLNSDPTVLNNPVIQGLDGGTYTVDVVDNNNCTISTDVIEIFEPAEIQVGFGDNVIIELGVDTVRLSPVISGGQGSLIYTYLGADLTNLSCTDCPDPFVRDQVFTKEYTLVVTDQQGCNGEDNVIVIISKDRRVWVPTGFTPNADNANDVLVPLGDPNTIVLNFQIFDRWGQLIFEQSDFNLGDVNFGWDGTFKGQKLDPGVFVWKAEVKYFEDGIEEAFAGETYLIR
ncbi:MAG: gliding motility-associated C-terminal domain-containing protein, partial [Bacteroidia bacterium]|nr:gliding motility-associated C-terminal domain-containing protein [Bacteroidia bacterium]